MKHYPLLIMLFALLSCQSNKEKTADEEWIQLFNGEDLSGWDIKISGFELNDNYKKVDI